MKRPSSLSGSNTQHKQIKEKVYRDFALEQARKYQDDIALKLWEVFQVSYEL